MKQGRVTNEKEQIQWSVLERNHFEGWYNIDEKCSKILMSDVRIVGRNHLKMRAEHETWMKLKEGISDSERFKCYN